MYFIIQEILSPVNKLNTSECILFYWTSNKLQVFYLIKIVFISLLKKMRYLALL